MHQSKIYEFLNELTVVKHSRDTCILIHGTYDILNKTCIKRFASKQVTPRRGIDGILKAIEHFQMLNK